MRKVAYQELTAGEPKDIEKPFLDRKVSAEEDAELTGVQQSFRDNGVYVAQGLIPDDLIDRYCRVRARVKSPGGWESPCPYIHVPELRDICLYRPMMDIMKDLIGYEMMLHLNLTGWVSTERQWHQDDYLNPSFVNSHYIAVWLALDDIHPDSGPFQYVAGSNRWPLIRQEKVFKIMKDLQGIRPEDPAWPSRTQDWVADACAEEIKRKDATVTAHLPKRGDVLFWSGRLIHQGSKPNTAGKERKALITHYSSIYHRPDMRARIVHRNQEWNSGGCYYDSKIPLEAQSA